MKDLGFLNTRIGRRLLATLLAVSLGPLLIMGGLAIKKGDAAIEQETRLHLAAVSGTAEAQLRELLRSLKEQTVTVSRDPRVSDALKRAAPTADEALTEVLTWYDEQLSDMREVFVLSSNGIVLASSDPKNVGKNHSATQPFLRGKEAFYPGDVSREDQGKATWTAAAPIMDRDGMNRLGVLACRMDLTILSDLTTGRRIRPATALRQSFRPGATGETYIVNRNHLMITESRAIPNAILSVKVETEPVRAGFEENRALLGEYRDYRGVNVTGTSVLLPALGWILITEIDFSQAYAPLQGLRNLLLATVAILGVGIVVLAYCWTRRVVAPIEKLRVSDLAMAEGNQAAAIASEANLPRNEIGDFVRLRNQRVKALFDKQRQLSEEQQRREQASGELQEMAYSMVHDMRAPLRAITNFGAILEQEAGSQLNEEHRDFLSRMRKAATRMDCLISDMLSYNRLSREEMPLYPVDVFLLVGDILDTYPALQSARKHIHVDPDLPSVWGNEGALLQCFTCLLDNAVKFATPGQVPEIYIRAEERKHEVRIWVKDNGIGIPKHMHERIFGIFQQGALSQTNTGIGLALVRKAVERMGGTFGVVSEPGHGSRFWIQLPRAGEKNDSGVLLNQALSIPQKKACE